MGRFRGTNLECHLESPKRTGTRFISTRMIRSRRTFFPSKWHHHRGGCRHGNSILRAYYVKVVCSWNAARHDSFLRRLSPRFRANTLKAPPTLTATVASEKLARFFQRRSTTPRALAIRFETRREIILLLHLARRSSSFALPFSSLLTSSPSVNRDAPRYHPRLTVWEKKAQFPSSFLPSFVYMGMYHAIFLLAILWTRSLLDVYFPSNLSPFSNYNPREDV